MNQLFSSRFVPNMKITLVALGLVGLFSPLHAADLASTPKPIVKIEAKYPVIAARERLEGYVIMSFTITKNGGVNDILIVEAKPENIFDHEAKRALKKWKYRPKVENGIAVSQPDMLARIDFTLN